MIEQPARMSNTSPTAPLYAELPYPGDGVIRTANARILLASLRRHAPHLLNRRGLRIVDIGCGTGESTLGLAKLFPEAEILGADINAAGLDLARELAGRTGTPVRFVQCDIGVNLAHTLEEASPGTFDVVSSVGVLHHLADPRIGFSEVRRVIRPDGIFYCFVYSHFGRREEMATKALLDEALPDKASMKARANALALLRLKNVHTLWNGIRRLRRRFKFGPPLRPLELVRTLARRNRLTHESDTYSNPCENLYRFSELKSLLSETGWEFVGLAQNAGMPTTPEEHSNRSSQVELLRQMPVEALYDYFAFVYEAWGFTFLCRPRDTHPSSVTAELRSGGR